MQTQITFNLQEQSEPHRLSDGWDGWDGLTREGEGYANPEKYKYR